MDSTVDHNKTRNVVVGFKWLIIYFSICSSSVGATSDCVFLAPPGQQGHRDGSVSPNTAKRDRSISVIAGKSIKNTLLFTI